MLKKFQLLSICLSFVFLGNAQKDILNKKFSPAQLKGDLEILVSDMKACHPGLYEYTSPEIFDSLANAFENGLTDSLTQDEFHVQVRKFIRVVGCGHTAAKPSAEWYKALKGKATLIPIHVFLHKGQLFVREVFDDGKDSLIGSRIISVDGVSTDKLLTELKSITGRDGVGETMVNRNIERLFQTYYMFLNGMSSDYSVKLERNDGQIVDITLEGKVPKRYITDRSYDLLDEMEAPSIKFGFIDSARKVALIDLDGFLPKGYKKIYRKAFKQMASMDSVNLLH